MLSTNMGDGELLLPSIWEIQPSEDRATVEYLCGWIVGPDGRRLPPPAEKAQRWEACCYEHARHSKVLRRLAEFHRSGKARGHEPERIVTETLGAFTSEPFVFSRLWQTFGSHFPKHSWRDVPKKLRPRPPEVPLLQPLDVASFDHYGKKARGEINLARIAIEIALNAGEGPPQMVPRPALFREGENGRQLTVAFQLDLTESKTLLAARFSQFLNQLPEKDATLLKRAKRAASEQVAMPTDWLRDLAVWRLSQRFNGDFEAVRDWIAENLKHPVTGKPLKMREDRGKGHAAQSRDLTSLKRIADRVPKHFLTLLPFESLPAKLASENAAFGEWWSSLISPTKVDI